MLSDGEVEESSGDSVTMMKDYECVSQYPSNCTFFFNIFFLRKCLQTNTFNQYFGVSLMPVFFKHLNVIFLLILCYFSRKNTATEDVIFLEDHLGTSASSFPCQIPRISMSHRH